MLLTKKKNLQCTFRNKFLIFHFISVSEKMSFYEGVLNVTVQDILVHVTIKFHEVLQIFMISLFVKHKKQFLPKAWENSLNKFNKELHLYIC